MNEGITMVTLRYSIGKDNRLDMSYEDINAVNELILKKDTVVRIKRRDALGYTKMEFTPHLAIDGAIKCWDVMIENVIGCYAETTKAVVTMYHIVKRKNLVDGKEYVSLILAYKGEPWESLSFIAQCEYSGLGDYVVVENPTI